MLIHRSNVVLDDRLVEACMRPLNAATAGLVFAPPSQLLASAVNVLSMSHSSGSVTSSAVGKVNSKVTCRCAERTAKGALELAPGLMVLRKSIGPHRRPAPTPRRGEERRRRHSAGWWKLR